MAIIGYKENGRPMFDNVEEYIEYENNKKVEAYKNRNQFEIMMDIKWYISELSDALMRADFCGFNEFKLEIVTLKRDMDKEFDLLYKMEGIS